MDESLEGVLLAEQFRITEQIAGGGMADVYRADDLRHGRPVAVKVLRPNRALGITDERFQREVEIASGLSHPHVLPLFQSGRHDNTFYFVMPYVEGDTLRSRLVNEPRLEEEQAIRIAAEIADGLQYAHAEGVIHRDIKPGNIFLMRGHAVLADFGVAKMIASETLGDLTQTGGSVGTPLYMSPEQAIEGVTDARSDVYSLGCVLYEMLTGDVPLRGATSVATFAARQTRPAPLVSTVRPEISPLLDDVVRRALEPSPDARFASASDFRASLLACLDDARLRSTAPGATPRRSPRFRRRGAVWGAAVVTISVAGVVLLKPGPKSGPIRTIAVLPFVELPDGGDGYLAEGVAQELRDQLSREETLLVASTESSVTAAGADTTAAGAARRLDVEGIVQGSVTRVRNRLSISVRLTDTRTERQAWGATLTGVPDEIFALQAAILDSLDRVLQLDDPTATAELRAMRTTDVATHNLYLQGRYAAGDRTPDALERAKTFFLSAIDLDPLYAPAWAALASAHALTGVYEYRSWIDLRPEAQAAAQEAIRLDASLAEAHTARAVLLDYDFRWEEAREAYERAIQLNANDAQAFHWYAVNRVLSGESEQASALIERARELNPLSFTIAVAAGWVYYYQRDFATAVARLESALDLEPNAWVAYQYLGLAYTDLGRYAEGIAALETARELNPSARSLLPGLARAHALAGDLELAGRLLEEARRGGAPMSWLAVGYLSVGDLDEALAWLERARDTGPWNVIEINTFWYDDLRGLPRFEALIADVQPIARVG